MNKLCPKCKITHIKESVNFCNRCSADFNIQHEPQRECPSDGNKMNKLRQGNIIIDSCPVCKGVWLDGNEVELFENASTKNIAVTAAFTGFVISNNK